MVEDVAVQGALKDALLALPAEEYDWFDLRRGEGKRRPRTAAPAELRNGVPADDQAIAVEAAGDHEGAEGRRRRFQLPGPPGLHLPQGCGELWRSRFDAERNLVVINNGHRDFVYAARSKMLKLRYICRLFAKELVLKNFIGIPPDQLQERLLELTLYTEENLRQAGRGIPRGLEHQYRAAAATR